MLGLVLLLGTSARADEDEGAHVRELFLGELATPQEERELQATLQGLADTEEVSSTLGIEYGITERLQVELSLPYEWMSDGERTGSLPGVGAGVGFALVDAEGGLQVVSGVEVAVPTNGERSLGYEGLLAAHRPLGPVHLNLQVGGEREEEETELAAGLSLPAEWVSPLLEFTWSEERPLGAAGVALAPSGDVENGLAGLVDLGTGALGATACLTMERAFGEEQ